MNHPPRRPPGNAVSTAVFFAPLMALYAVGLWKAGCWLLGLLHNCF